jgi:hypothetical protein
MLFPWYLLCLLFVLPFVDPRRPLRLLHLDLAVLVATGLWPLRVSVQGGRISSGASIFAMIGLVYLLGRLTALGFGLGIRRERLVPLVPLQWLVVGVAILAGFRLGYIVADPVLVIDVGEASVEGADRITKGEPLYQGSRGTDVEHGETYGPVMYLSYVPFELVVPRRRLSWRAARVAAVTFDLLTMVALFMLGTRLRPGRGGEGLGVALAYAWAAYPYSLFVLSYSFNDGLVALLVLVALLSVAYPARRAALAALAAWSKFAPAVLAPLLATGTGERRLRSLLAFTAVFAAVTLAVFLPFIPDGGLSELYDRTLGFQQERVGVMPIWARVPELDSLQTAVQVVVVGIALAFAFVPRRRTLAQLAALAGALLIAAQLAATNWAPSYAVWFAPVALAAIFAQTREGPPSLAAPRHKEGKSTVAQPP